MKLNGTLTPEEAAKRFLDAQQVMLEGVWPADHDEHTELDVQYLRGSYEKYKWTMASFGDAARQAKTELLSALFSRVKWSK